ncbi:TetR/AcrR family transcriptional regulator [Pseudorhodoferax sp.]|uniref:TetR/AcrR family transcriptional regulator n=1 Tax=Pseudorhodoferax sp. TaxID=1993553 RepID=UPI002DD6B66D|nr:TetR/AcrR family transcriptional regulator [Pseudorhodoferax sp.]
MDPTPSRKQLTHDRIVETAAGVMREAGFWGVGVADVMKRAGLTHGGFYAHFASRDALLCEAIAHAGRDSAARLAKSTAQRQARGASPLRALVDAYLSEGHLAASTQGCPVAALASEMPRQSAEVAAAATVRVRALVDAVGRTLPADAAEQASVVAAQLVGALQLARALGDNAEGRALLAATRRNVLAQFDTAPAR